MVSLIYTKLHHNPTGTESVKKMFKYVHSLFCFHLEALHYFGEVLYPSVSSNLNHPEDQSLKPMSTAR